MPCLNGSVLHIATRRYLRDAEEEVRESRSRRELRELLRRLDRELLARLFS